MKKKKKVKKVYISMNIAYFQAHYIRPLVRLFLRVTNKKGTTTKKQRKIPNLLHHWI